MPRKARIDAPGALHHIIVRGIERRHIFRGNKDRNRFLERFGDALLKTATPCYAWALMPNHAHFLLKTGFIPISALMHRVLTSHAAYFNRRHKRHGKLFQNRYKSILCQEDPYFLELVRYIHLNPLRGAIVDSVDALRSYNFTGHSAIVGRIERPWQDVDYVLRLFAPTRSWAKRRYKQYIESGAKQGRRPELTGGGLIRSLGGWSAAKSSRRYERMKSDERILGDGEFVEEMLRIAVEQMTKRYGMAAKGFDLDSVAARVAEVFDIAPERIWQKGKRRDIVNARHLLCYWAVRELGIKGRQLARRLDVTDTAITYAVKRGAEIAGTLGVLLTDTGNFKNVNTSPTGGGMKKDGTDFNGDRTRKGFDGEHGGRKDHRRGYL